MNMIKTVATLAVTAGLSLSAVTAVAHKVVIDANTALVPIPAYNPPASGASVAASVQTLNAFLDTFNPVFHKIYPLLKHDFGDKSRANWSNLPPRFAERQGLSLGEMTVEQRKLFFDFLSSALGKDGYKTVSEVLAAEAFLVENQPAKSTWMKIAPDHHAFSIYGEPSLTGKWGWQFGGHHLAINVSYDNGSISSISPSFIGAEPAVFKVKGQSFHTNEDMHKAGYAVFASLSTQQKKFAKLIAPPEEALTLGAGSDGKITPQFGISGADLSKKQQTLLLNAIRQWVEIQPDEAADERMAEIAKNIDKLSYAWHGTGDVNTHAYMRIQGPTVIIEMLSMESRIGSGYGHYHTIYRNPTMEYGVQKRKRL